MIARAEGNGTGLFAAAAEMIRPRVKLAPSIWTARNGYLDDQVEAAGGRYDFAHHPWFVQPIDYLDDNDVRFVNLMMSPQLGKTILLLMSILCCADQNPCPAMAVLPEKTAAIEFRDRVYGNALVSPRTRHLPPAESKWNTRHLDLGGMRVYLAWSGAKQALRGRRCKRVWLSEIDVYEPASAAGDPLRSAEQRVKAFYNWQIWKESSPVADPSRIAEAFYASRQHYWHCPCPDCGHWQEMRFFPHHEGHAFAGKGGILGWRDESGARLPADEARKNAYYLCEQGCKIAQQDKNAMFLAGKWVAEGQQIEGLGRKGKLRGEPKRSKRAMGHHLWAIANETVSIGDLAAEYVTARESDTVADFWQNTLAKPYSRQAARPKWEVLGANNAGDHARGTVPAWAWFLTAGFDVQMDRVYFVVRAWGDHRTSALVDWRMFERTSHDGNELIKSDLSHIPDLLLNSYPIADGKANPQGYQHLQILLAGIDCGHRPLDVHRLVQKVRQSPGNQERFIAVRGDAKVDRALRWRYSEVSENQSTGAVYEEVHQAYHLAVDVFKEELAQRQGGNPRDRGGWWVTADTLRLGQEYLRQVVNEAPILEKKPSGRTEYVWRPISRSTGVDYWDCEVYAAACAEMVAASRFGEAGWDAEKWLAMSRTKGRRVDREGVAER
jgi:phage terminase large subunit GpA-like protein